MLIDLCRPARLHGFALVTALILLLVLTLVGLVAIRGTGLELRMSANDALRTEALDRAETSRAVTVPVIDVHVFNRGWPVSRGGDVPDNLFDYEIPASLSLAQDSGKPRDWYLNNLESVTDTSYVFQPTSLTSDASYARNITIGSATPVNVSGDLAVYKARTAINSGAGAAMVAGYEGTGKAAAASGANIFFFVASRGAAPGDEANTLTGTVFRNVVRN